MAISTWSSWIQTRMPSRNGFDLEKPIPFPQDKYYTKCDSNTPVNLKSTDVWTGKFETQTFHLKKGNRIKWWITGNRKMGFGFFKAKSEDDSDFERMDQVCPIFPWMPGPLLVPLEAEIVIKEDGIYKIWFGNERSWWCTLTVQHVIEVTEK